jgi:hypothetical protein
VQPIIWPVSTGQACRTRLRKKRNERARPLQRSYGPPEIAFTLTLTSARSMARRRIKDDLGIIWDVWDVDPDDALGPVVYDRRSSARRSAELAAASGTQWFLHAELENGWLCFQSGIDRRRFAPIPPGWVDLSDELLRAMLSAAAPVGASSGLRPRPSAAE